MLYIYKSKNLFFEKYRSEPDLPFPWEEKDISHWRKLMSRNILLLIANIFIIAPTLAILLDSDKSAKSRMDLESWPSLGEILWQIVFCSFC